MGNSLQIGTVINDKWVILEFIAKGGMGEVYRAHQLNLKRDVAIKIISKEWLATLLEDEEGKVVGLERFRNEVQAMAQAQHPNILQIFDYGTFSPPGHPDQNPLEYIVMEYVQGSTLRSTMSEEGFYPEGDMTRDWIRKYFMPILDGVEALHSLGIVHRDLKPENVLIDKNTPKIADFGLAHSSKLRPVTQSSDMKGTPAYMSPEQFMDFRRTDERTDIYALGKILYEAIDGKISSNAIPFKQSKLDKTDTTFFRNLDLVIQEATSGDKERRISSVDELRRRLIEALETEGSTKNAGTGSMLGTEAPAWHIFNKKRFLFVCMLGAIFFVVLSLWAFNRPKGISPVLPRTAGSNGTPVGAEKTLSRSIEIPSEVFSEQPPRTVSMEDGAALHLIPGGTVQVKAENTPGVQGKITVGSFYMDETLVTNHQYVDFLNQVLDVILVEKDVVKAGGKIWLFLGQALPGYEPIIYKEGRFYINKPGHASCPVIRVTAYGAEAYAQFYGRRLPTSDEWAYALIKGQGDKNSQNKPLPKPGAADDQQSGAAGTVEMEVGNSGEPRPTEYQGPEPPHFPSPVLNSRANSLGIRGLNGGISEWGIRYVRTAGQDPIGQAEYVILGGLKGSLKKGAAGIPDPLARKPWEASEEVGFRTVKEIHEGPFEAGPLHIQP